MITRPSDEDIAAVLEFLPYFENTSNQFYEVSDKLFFDPYFYANEVERFVRALSEHGFIQPFDWPEWVTNAKRYADHPELIAGARLSTLVRLLTTHVRQDRFVGGHLAWAIDSGQILAILRRLKVLSSKDERPKTKD